MFHDTLENQQCEDDKSGVGVPADLLPMNARVGVRVISKKDISRLYVACRWM
jgi:hypothetical protein